MRFDRQLLVMSEREIIGIFLHFLGDEEVVAFIFIEPEHNVHLLDIFLRCNFGDLLCLKKFNEVLEPDHEAPIGDLDYEYYYYIEILWHN
jgi:hypothetical protein